MTDKEIEIKPKTEEVKEVVTPKIDDKRNTELSDKITKLEEKLLSNEKKKDWEQAQDAKYEELTKKYEELKAKFEDVDINENQGEQEKDVPLRNKKRWQDRKDW